MVRAWIKQAKRGATVLVSILQQCNQTRNGTNITGLDLSSQGRKIGDLPPG
jgi:hypothetical protein